MELSFCSINSPWISNEFFFTCFSGAVASILVLIITDSYKFIQAKQGIEQFIFTQLAFIYGQLQITDRNISNIISKGDDVAGNFLDHLTFHLQQIIPQLRVIDYNPLIKTTKTTVIKQVIFRLLSDQLNNLDALVRECIYLQMAISTDKINHNTKKMGQLLNFTKESVQKICNLHNDIQTTATIKETGPMTIKTLLILQKIIRRNMNQLQIDISEINAACANRFHWADTERNISNITIPDTSLESFFERNQ